jgi:hypothetical protein
MIDLTTAPSAPTPFIVARGCTCPPRHACGLRRDLRSPRRTKVARLARRAGLRRCDASHADANLLHHNVQCVDVFGKPHQTMDNRTGRDLRSHFK